jgi:SAM-dependent methyltransferase
MRSVAEHYADHLAPIYVWMAGRAEAALAAGESELDALHLPAQPGDSVLDLGAAFGAHAIPLAQRGAHVTAVDSSPELLDHLHQLGSGLPVRRVNPDLVVFFFARRSRLVRGDSMHGGPTDPSPKHKQAQPQRSLNRNDEAFRDDDAIFFF